MKGFAFFDLDHTLLPFDTQALFTNFILRRDRRRTAYLPIFLPLGLLKALRLVRTVTAKRAFLSHLAGMNRDTLLGLAREFAGQVVKPWIYPELLERIEHHRRAGRILVLNTASPDFYAKEIGLSLGFHHCVATPFEIPAILPRLPRVTGANNKHGEKIRRMKDEIPEFAGAGPEALRDSWSFSDSAADLPLLELAGRAVLVHPSPSLEKLGRARGWEILRPPRPYAGRAGDLLTAATQALGCFDSTPPGGAATP